MKNIPMSFFPLEMSKKLARPFYGFGSIIDRSMRDYNLVLQQANLDVTPNEFFAIAFLNMVLFGLVFMFCFAFLFYSLKIENFVIIGLFFGMFFGVMTFIRIVAGLKIGVQKKIKSINSNLVFGLKILLVEINAGVSLFDAIVMVATHDLGELSNLFKEISKRLNSGEKEEEVLKDIATKNPSKFLKKVLWQIVSGLKSGASLNKVLDESLTAIEREQKTEILQYGSSLRVLTLMFMMMGVVIPAMGLAFLAVMSSLPGLTLPQEIFWVFLVTIIVMQFMIIGFIKSKRPDLMGSI